MALSYSAVQKAFEVFNELKLSDIRSWPPEWRDVDPYEKENPREQCTYGYDKKYDNGWEQLFFFVKNPSKEFKENWDRLKKKVPNSSFCDKHEQNPEYTVFGWF